MYNKCLVSEFSCGQIQFTLAHSQDFQSQNIKEVSELSYDCIGPWLTVPFQCIMKKAWFCIF